MLTRSRRTALVFAVVLVAIPASLSFTQFDVRWCPYCGRYYLRLRQWPHRRAREQLLRCFKTAATTVSQHSPGAPSYLFQNGAFDGGLTRDGFVNGPSRSGVLGLPV